MNPISLIFHLQHYRLPNPFYAENNGGFRYMLYAATLDRTDWIGLGETTASPTSPSLLSIGSYASLPNPLRQHVPHENDFLDIVHGSRERDIGQVVLQAPEIETRDEHMSCRTRASEEYRVEDDDDDVPTMSGNNDTFFATVVGVTYHVNSFLELNLLRPLLRACEARCCLYFNNFEEAFFRTKNRLAMRVLILTPTRELVFQVALEP
ncbi:dead box ATP-dependent RNA helicase [Striga asiatica]|uniref:Dead box ATP-dependent RNA helicase n=1 Tax=Striga asiatica TaxID=4170 RepID=A0A5A7RG04_STRAF|nr:dead box ATP-dependent RNA helicase [Striga asiatica]